MHTHFIRFAGGFTVCSVERTQPGLGIMLVVGVEQRVYICIQPDCQYCVPLCNVNAKEQSKCDQPNVTVLIVWRQHSSA